MHMGCYVSNALGWSVPLNSAFIEINGCGCQASGYTPLHSAARYDFTECVMALLAVGCDVNTQAVGAHRDQSFPKDEVPVAQRWV